MLSTTDMNSYAVVQVTPLGIKHLRWKFYLMFCVLNASFLLPIYLFLPETAGKTLEAVDILFTECVNTQEQDIDTSNADADVEGHSDADARVCVRSLVTGCKENGPAH